MQINSLIPRAFALPQSKIFAYAMVATSQSEARRHIRAGALRLTGEPVRDEHAHLQLKGFDTDNQAQLSVGRKRHVRLMLRD